MPSSIPVRVADRDFRSINQARLHYVGILHRVPTGQKLEEADNADVLKLIHASGLHLAPEAKTLEAAQGSFGRKCLVARPCQGEAKTLSILRAVKECALKPQVATATQAQAGAVTPTTLGTGPTSSKVGKLKAPQLDGDGNTTAK